MSYKFESEVTNSLGELLKTEANYDVIIHIGKQPNFQEFHAHSVLLYCRSYYFSKLLSAKDIKKKNEKYIIKKPDITPQAFDVIIKYLYTGHINISDETGMEILNIIIASDDLKLDQLIKVTEDFFIKNYRQFLQNDPVEILQTVNCYQILNNIQKYCLETVCSEPEILFNSTMFIKLPAFLLEIILKQDDLNLDEIKVWENLVKWGLAQEKTLNEDVSKWNQEKFNMFERILHKFIPLIRFSFISSEDYFNKVRPYEEILSKELREDILKFHMIPGYKLTVNNFVQRFPKYTLINRNHLVVFANWIDRKTEYVKEIPYKSILLYRASRDGNTTAAFHEKCDNKGATIVIAKIINSEQIIGGYNPLYWDTSSSCKHTNDSFLFSFTDRNNLLSAKVAYCNQNQQYAIYCYPNYGPTFGGGNDLICDNGTWYSDNHPYSYSPKVINLEI